MHLSIGCIAAASLITSAALAAPPAPDQCFYNGDYQGFRAIDAHSFYIRVGVRDIYRVDLEGACPVLTEADAHLVTVQRGGDRICGPLDWDLRVVEPFSNISVACIVKRQTRLTPAEIAALPKASLP